VSIPIRGSEAGLATVANLLSKFDLCTPSRHSSSKNRSEIVIRAISGGLHGQSRNLLKNKSGSRVQGDENGDTS
jgi:hypothetical protein